MDNLNKEQRKHCMQRIKSKGTAPEKKVLKILDNLNTGYENHVKTLAGTPDIVIKNEKKVIFINGCFWHYHKNCKYSSVPKTNNKYWSKKLGRNQERQKENIRELKKQGWSVSIIWECQTKDEKKLLRKVKRSLYMKKIIEFKLAELFCGPGGLALGALNALVRIDGSLYKIKPIWANDIDKYACMTYERNIHNGNGGQLVCKPIEHVDLESIPKIDALAFGFPCNDFSIVGEHKGTEGKYGPLYKYGVKVLNIRNPKWFFAENVSGIQSANKGKALEKILEELENAGKGYNLTTHLYKFEEYGVPQYRHRIVIIGIRKDLNLKFKVPAPKYLNKHISSKEAIESPPIPANAPNNELTRQTKLVIERLKYIPAGKNAWHEGIPEQLRLKVKGAKMSQIYRRLDPNKPSYTITGSGGGGTHGYHWNENRALTNRERARIQTFPDSFIFEGPKENVRKQIGMAVPPKGAEIIFEAILKTIGRMSYDYIEEKINNGNL
jgi:DNA (cytosine-5)-methyltransferase 1